MKLITIICIVLLSACSNVEKKSIQSNNQILKSSDAFVIGETKLAPLESIKTDKVNTKLYFAFNRSSLDDNGKSELDKVANLMFYSKIDISIVGYADRIGTQKYNQSLSDVRAQTAKVYLINKGINANRIKAIGKGMILNSECQNKNKELLIICLQPDRKVLLENLQ